MRDDGDTSQDDSEDEDTDTSEKGLSLTGHSLILRGRVLGVSRVAVGPRKFQIFTG